MKLIRPILLLAACACVVPAVAQKKSAAKTQAAPVVSDSNYFKLLTWRNVGPTRGGRVTAVEGITSQPGTFYMGATGGGLWKTDDYGTTWRNVSDGFFQTPSIGAIRVVPSNPKIVYVGTGSDGIRSNVIAGKGVYKSTDGGKKWKNVGLEKVGQIGAVEIHPTHPDTVFVAAVGQAFQPNRERGVYRTHDGGKTWQQVLYVADSIGAVDLEFAPGNPSIVYATMWRAERKPWTIISGGNQAGGFYKSTDGGTTWKKITTGLPAGLIGKIDLAVSPADPRRVYALVEAPRPEGGVYRSDDQGESFKQVSDKKELVDRPFYYCNIEVNPMNPDVLFIMATDWWKSTDAGKNWKRQSNPHGDNHDLWINKRDTLIMIQSNDGGANVTVNGGKTWSSQHNQPTSELYQVDTDDQYPYWLYAGQQDNTTISVPSLPPMDVVSGNVSFWMNVGGCETGPAIPKPGDPNIVYSNCKGRFGVFDKRTGQERLFVVGGENMYGHDPDDLQYRFQRVSPIAVSPHNSSVVYHASQYLHRTMDEGLTWETISPDLTAREASKQVVSGFPITRDVTGEEFYSTIYDVKESPRKAGVIWVGANDGPVSVTQDNGRTWKRVTPAALPGGGRIDCVEPSPHQDGKAYFTSLRYQLGDWRPYVYRTLDYGATWTLLTTGANGIAADNPVRVVREDPDKEGLLYAGTEQGMYVSTDDGAHWQSLQLNLPITPVTDIKVFRKDLVISTMGRGFWILDNITPLHQLTAARAADFFLFQPADGMRFRHNASRGGEVPSYTAPGVLIDYQLRTKLEGDLKLEILKDGKVIRSFSSALPARDTTGQQKNMATNFTARGQKPDLDKSPGSHRFRWDMMHEGAWDKDPARSKRGSITVSPGRYTVRLSSGDKNTERTFSVLADPRTIGRISQDDMTAQETLALQVQVLEDSSKRIAAAIQRQRKEISFLVKTGKATAQHQSKDAALAAVEGVLVTREGPYEKPQLIDQLNYLRSMLDQADQRPGQDAYTRYKALSDRAQSVFRSYAETRKP